GGGMELLLHVANLRVVRGAAGQGLHGFLCTAYPMVTLRMWYGTDKQNRRFAVAGRAMEFFVVERGWPMVPSRPGGFFMPRNPLLVPLCALLLSFAAYAADQTILGKQELVKDPKPGVDATKRKLLGQANEVGSTNTIVGDPTVDGATVTFFASGAT